LRRNARSDSLPASVVGSVFRTPKGSAAEVEGADPDHRYVFRVTEVNVPPVDLASPEGTRLEGTLRSALSEDLLRQYITYIEAQIGTRTYADVLARVSGGEAF
jgi:peptidyl-prolyl cis-trans isomerase D